MLLAGNFEVHCARLVDPGTPLETRKELATEIRDSIDLYNLQDYQSFLNIFLPAFKTVLNQLTRPQQVDNTTHRLRALILEILNRFPHNDILKAKLLDVLNLAMDALRIDNENNAALAIHIVLDLHKNFRNQLDGQVQPFLDFVILVYEGFGKTVENLLVSHKDVPATGKPAPARIAPSTQSFKHEIPVQLLARIPKNTFNEFIAAQVKTVSFLAYLLKQFPELMKTDETSVPRSVVKLMQSCPGGAVSIRKELLVATRHILGSPYRSGFFDQLDLLLDEKVLVGTGRATTDTLRPIAYSFLAELVHCVRLKLSIPQLEKIVFLFSTNIHDPNFSYSLQTSSVRLLLNLIEGILKTDPENVAQRTSARELLVKILETMVSKYLTLGEEVPRLLKRVQQLRDEEDPIESGQRLCEIPIGDPLKEISDFKSLLKTLTLGLKTVIWSAINIRVHRSHTGRSAQQSSVQSPAPDQMAARLSNMTGTKSSRVRMGLLEKESEMVSTLLAAGRKCFRLYARNEKANGGEEKAGSASCTSGNPPKVNPDQKLITEISHGLKPPSVYASTVAEEKEVFNLFAQIFTVLDPPSFQDVFGSRIGYLFDYIVENPAAISVPQHFLANNGVSKYFADILLNFLVENIHGLEMTGNDGNGSSDARRNRANALLKLFKIVFASVSLFPTNEPVLHLHLATIVRNSLKHAANSTDPAGFLQMLKALFKSINNDKNQIQFDLLYQSFAPLLEHIYDKLLALFEGPCGAMHKDLIIELFLLAPARTSNAFPHLNKLIKPIVWALEAESETAGYGLRNLEFWVNILQPSYLDRLLADVEPALTISLHKHLKAPRKPIAMDVVRVIGKLGSRSRLVKGLTVPFDYEKGASDFKTIRIDWPGGTSVDLEIDGLIRLTVDALQGRRHIRLGKSSVSYNLHAWKFLFSCLSPFLGQMGSSAEIEKDAEQTPSMWSLIGYPESVRLASCGSKDETRRSLSVKSGLVKTILFGLVIASSSLIDDEYQSNIKDMSSGEEGSPVENVKRLCRYFALLTVQECNAHAQGVISQSLTTCSYSALTCSVFVDVLIEAMSQAPRKHSKAGLWWMGLYIKNILEYCSTLKTKEENLETVRGRECSPQETSTDKGKTPMDGVSSPKHHTWAEGLSALLKDSDGREDRVDIDPGMDLRGSVLSEKKTGDDGQADGVKVASQTGKQRLPYGMSYTSCTVRSLGQIIKGLAHCCYKRLWNFRWAAAYGFDTLLKHLPGVVLRSSTFSQYYMLMFRAILFLIRDSTEASTNSVIMTGQNILCGMFQAVFDLRKSQRESVSPVSGPYGKHLREMVLRLLLEILSTSATARETGRSCITALSKVLGVDVVDLIIPLKEHIIRPLQQRPLRQHSIALQLGYLEAVNFCFELGKPVISAELFSSPLREYLLIESMYLLENNALDPVPESDEAFKNKFPYPKYYEAETIRQLLYLRRQVLELLRNLSTHCSDFLKQPANESLYKSVTNYFFKNIQSKDEQIVQSSKQGLKQAIDRHQRPKELLQQNLRPMLTNLGDYKMLTISYLQGLSRILELFSHWFNVSLGEKLLEHLQKWTEPEKIASVKKIALGSESRVAAAILDLFHLLPSSASQFLPRVVDMVIRLEAVLTLAAPGAAHLGLKNSMSASTSPYRAPLLKYCDQHASAASEFLLPRLGDEKMRQLFFVMVGTNEAHKLRKDLMDKPERLFSPSIFGTDSGQGKTLYIISLIDLLATRNPSWLSSDPIIMSSLISYWRKLTRSNDISRHDSSSRYQVQALKILSEVFIRYCKTFRSEVNLLFELLAVFSFRTTCDFTFVKSFLDETVTQVCPNPSKNSIIRKFFAVFQDASTSQERKLHGLHYVVIPLISHHLKKNTSTKGQHCEKVSDSASEARANLQPSKAALAKSIKKDNAPSQGLTQPAKTEQERHGVQNSSSSRTGKAVTANTTQSALSAGEKEDTIDPALVQKIVTDVLDQPDETLRCYDELLSVELLRLATVLIKHTPVEIGRYRRELIKFGWNNLKREESAAKYWAFVAVTQFFESYQAPTKLVLQVYVALLRACQADGKNLVQRALDTLMPVLPRHLVHNPSEHKYPIWIRYTKKILLEDGHSIQNLVHIWQIIARHPRLFFLSRAQFVPFMVNSLSKFALTPNAAPENRRLGLDLVDLIIGWEETRRQKKSDGSFLQEDDALSSSHKKRPREEHSDGHDHQGKSGTINDPRDAGPPAKLQKGNDGQPLTASKAATSVAVASKTAQDADDFKPNATMLDLLASFLVQMPIRPTDQRETSLITRRSLKLLERLLQLWPDTSIRLNFVERLLTPIPTEKQPNTASTASSGKGQSNTMSTENHTVDNKGHKTYQRSDKTDQVRMKRIAVRNSALVTSLLVSSVAIKYQGLKFVELNKNAIRAFIQPSVTENAISTASQFSSLIPIVLEKYKPLPSNNISPKSGVSKALVKPGEEQSKAPGSSTKSSLPSSEARSESGDQTWVAKFMTELHTALEMCLKSNDHRQNYCGMLVLKALWTASPQEFLKYKEKLMRLLQRMVKEFLTSGQAAGTAGAASSLQGAHHVTGRAQKTVERGSGQTVTNSNMKAGSTKAQESVGDAAKGAKGKVVVEIDSLFKRCESECLRLCLSLVKCYIATLDPNPKRQVIHVLLQLIDKGTDVEVLIQVVKLVESLVFWSPSGHGIQPGAREPLTTKDKTQLLQRMIAFEKIKVEGSQRLMDAYLSIILKSFRGGESPHRRLDVQSKLERGFMIGLKSHGSSLRQKFFEIYESYVGGSATFRLHYIISKHEWEFLADTLWIRNATELLISSAEKDHRIELASGARLFPKLASYTKDEDVVMEDASQQRKNTSQAVILGISDVSLWQFGSALDRLRSGDFVASLISLMNRDEEIACKTWVLVVPQVWAQLAPGEQTSLGKSLSSLLNKEYHQTQVSWPRNNIQALLESVVRFQPLPCFRANSIRYLGSRWNAWHSALTYLELRHDIVLSRLEGETISDKTRQVLQAELEDIADSQIKIFVSLQEKDYLAGAWKARARMKHTYRGLSFEQMGLFADAQEAYEEGLGENISTGSISSKTGQAGSHEILFCEERWIECAKNLCQWEVLTELSRTAVNPKLLHECLWRIADWTALKDLLRKKPSQDSSKMQIYEAYVHLQQNKLEEGETFVKEGFERALEKLASLPESADFDCMETTLVQFQQLVELQESAHILNDLNALSRHDSANVKVEQKIENVRKVLNTWRERLPSPHEPLWIWNDILLWRNHVHAVVVNVLEALKEAANSKIEAAQNSSAANTSGIRNASVNTQVAQVQAANVIAQALPQHVLVMGVNETAWNVHRFAKTCRKQGFPDVALYVLQKLYPFGTMEVTEYFMKTKEMARAYMVGPRGLEKHVESGLQEISRCNMDHLNTRQRAQLFALKGKLLAQLGREDESVEAISTALYNSADVGSAWLSWGQHCDNMQKKAAEDPSAFSNFAEGVDADEKQIEELIGVSSGYAAELAFRESAVKCYLQAVRFGSRRARAFLPRVLRLLSLDVQSRVSFDFTTRSLIEHQNSLTPSAAKTDPGSSSAGADKDKEKSLKGTLSSTQGQGNVEKVKGVGSQSESTKTEPLSSERKGVSRALSAAILDIPSWMWLPWLPQLLQMLGRKEGLTVTPILTRIARQFPQAIYFPLKAYMEDRKGVDRPKRQLFREALKLWRPVAAPLRMVATPAHLEVTMKQVQQLKDQVQKLNRKYLDLRKELEKTEETVQASVQTNARTQESARAVEKRDKLRNTVLQLRKYLEKSVQNYHLNVQRQRQIQESIPGGPRPSHGHGGLQSSASAQKSGKAESGNKAEQKEVSKSTVIESKDKKDGNEAGTKLGTEEGGEAQGGAKKGGPLNGAQAQGMKVSTSTSPYELADTIMAQVVKYHQEMFLELEGIATDLSYRLKIEREELLLGLMNALLLRCFQSGTKSWKEEIKPSIRSALEEISRSSFGIGVSEQQGMEQKGGGELSDLKEAFAAELSPQTAKEFPEDVGSFIERLRRWQGIFQKRVDRLPEYVKLEKVCKQLLNINGSEIEVIQRATGCCRGIEVLGSDGKWYRFVAEQYGLHVQMAEQRAGQLLRLVNDWVFAKEAVAMQKRMHVAVGQYISTGARSRLVRYEGEMSSLSEALEEYVGRRGEGSEDVMMAFRRAERAGRERRVGEKGEALSVSEVFAARVEAYEAVCGGEGGVGDGVLAEWVRRRMRDVEGVMWVRKRFAETVGSGSAVWYALGVGSRRPQNFVVRWDSGTVQHVGVRVLVSSRGVVEHDEAVPFRLTRNMRAMMGGGVGVGGPLMGALSGALLAMARHEDELRVFAECVMRDEVGAGCDAGAGASCGSEVRHVDELAHVEQCLRASVARVGERLRGATVAAGAEGAAALALGERLLRDAVAVRNLARMECSFQGWF
ncbi:Transcription-associated protein 1 [Gracilariopsis chorda]|uniref:Transcription-associated protein 1 n=1 Tax=Gracilariopsis chorda TaxID=448386 RepID=A0A2V3IFJ2_9FLOR|nr:Transcription-associated protein 1 [Gracilariopsis chorda]|eukprot:PXF39940.1 Transcription-associated protein 1 [Gracilariopsis chorda]